MMLRADGRSAINETIYDGRFNYIPELVRMGADHDMIEPFSFRTA